MAQQQQIHKRSPIVMYISTALWIGYLLLFKRTSFYKEQLNIEQQSNLHIAMVCICIMIMIVGLIRNERRYNWGKFGKNGLVYAVGFILLTTLGLIVWGNTYKNTKMNTLLDKSIEKNTQSVQQ